jgi:hypothetical protein
MARDHLVHDEYRAKDHRTWLHSSIASANIPSWGVSADRVRRKGGSLSLWRRTNGLGQLNIRRLAELPAIRWELQIVAKLAKVNPSRLEAMALEEALL